MLESEILNMISEPRLLLAILFCLLPVPVLCAGQSDVVVVGGTPGGIASALAAARAGRSVTLVEYHDHIGGMMTSGLGKSDIENGAKIAGLFKEFIGRIHDHYTQTHGVEHDKFSSIRMEPTWMALGQAAAVAADLALKHDVSPRRVPIEELQQKLTGQGNSCGHHTVCRDGDLYRMYHKAAVQVLKDEPIPHRYFATTRIKARLRDSHIG